MSERLIFCGDIHGEFNELVFNLLSRYQITNANVIVVGDFGIGFEKKGYWDNLYNRNKKKLENADIVIYALRGNHDDPSYFVNPTNYDRLIFLEDHKLYNISGHNIYTIGGANSVDIVSRLEYNEYLKSRGKTARVWWEDEDVVRVPIEDIKKISPEIIISHESPLCLPPITGRLSMTPIEQYGKILETRTYLSEVLNTVQPDYWFYGHHHKSYSGNYTSEEGKVINYRGLGIMEFYELEKQEGENDGESKPN